MRHCGASTRQADLDCDMTCEAHLSPAPVGALCLFAIMILIEIMEMLAKILGRDSGGQGGGGPIRLAY